MNNKYITTIQTDKNESEIYYQKYLKDKSEQQKFLEELLLKENLNPKIVADIACGSGTLSFHINKLYPQSEFLLVDLNDEALELARHNLKNLKVKFYCESLYDIKSIEENSCDLVFCWQTLSWLEDPQKALKELLRICKKNGKIFISSLFNLEHEVDIYSRVYDLTRKTAAEDMYYPYNTYSAKSIGRWLENDVKSFDIIEFVPPVDIKFEGKGAGTYTIKTENGKRLQISGGMLMNWGILIITK